MDQEKPKGSIHRWRARVVKGFANHRRIEVMEMLDKTPELTLSDIVKRVRSDYQTIAHHVQKLEAAGLVLKWHDGAYVRHKLSPLGRRILAFLHALR